MTICLTLGNCLHRPTWLSPQHHQVEIHYQRDLYCFIRIQDAIWRSCLHYPLMLPFGMFGSLRSAKSLRGWQCKIEFGWQIVFKEGDGQIAGISPYATKFQNRGHISYTSVDTQQEFGRMCSCGVASKMSSQSRGQPRNPRMIGGLTLP
jgi:hypothetical protein